MAKNDTKIKVISLKPLLDLDAAEEMVDSRKVKTFQTLLHKPKISEVHLHSLTLHYESILILSITIQKKTMIILDGKYYPQGSRLLTQKNDKCVSQS